MFTTAGHQVDTVTSATERLIAQNRLLTLEEGNRSSEELLLLTQDAILFDRFSNSSSTERNAFFETLAANQIVKSLYLNAAETPLSAAHLDGFCDALRQSQTLTKFYLISSVDAGITTKLAEILNVEKIKELYLTVLSQVTPWENIVNAVLQNNTLEHIFLQDNATNDNPFMPVLRQLLEGLRLKRGLTTLEFAGYKTDEDTLKLAEEILLLNPTITHMNFDYDFYNGQNCDLIKTKISTLATENTEISQLKNRDIIQYLQRLKTRYHELQQHHIIPEANLSSSLLAILIQETTPSLQDRANHALLRQILDPTSNLQARDDNMPNLQTPSSFVLKYYSNVSGPASQEVHNQARIAEKRSQFSSIHRDIRKIGGT